MTLCELADVEVDQRHQAVDSISFARVLVDDYKASPRHWLYTTVEKVMKRSTALGRQHAIRKGSLKLISLQQPVGGVYHRKLYNLTEDLTEERNLISDTMYQEDVREMITRLAAYAGPAPRFTAPFCNLRNCGSVQVRDEKKVTTLRPISNRQMRNSTEISYATARARARTSGIEK